MFLVVCVFWFGVMLKNRRLGVATLLVRARMAISHLCVAHVDREGAVQIGGALSQDDGRVRVDDIDIDQPAGPVHMVALEAVDVDRQVFVHERPGRREIGAGRRTGQDEEDDGRERRAEERFAAACSPAGGSAGGRDRSAWRDRSPTDPGSGG